MTESRFPNLPSQLAKLKVDERGFPVPWFISWHDGKPDFVAVDPRKIAKAHNERRCWICGQTFGIGGMKTFVVGPMCVVNRVSAEPPSHLMCARFAATACPFLTRPLAKRARHAGEEYQAPPGIMLERNPGVSALWIAASYRTQAIDGGMLFRLGTPMNVEWWSQGRRATRAEVLEGLETGLPFLLDVARQDGPDAMSELTRLAERSLKFIPA